MVPLIITYVSHTVPKCCKCNATRLERLPCDNWWLIGDVCPSSGHRSCEEYDLCPVQDIKVVVVCGNSGNDAWGCHGRWLGMGQHWYQ